ncbi:hypothetical protein [Fimbriiglobus ruber]|uniref:Uncharacterized protein n=1 Tax=Fimbriiglobus ruber TaxID=1908690 RepID=A0A225D727_9BACT|nr:hypothetical protein [Fimbriiglobus ruber]OWK35454.1 hypothetical protein FRUB_08017 [Fimbriiglobus ruber]
MLLRPDAFQAINPGFLISKAYIGSTYYRRQIQFVGIMCIVFFALVLGMAAVR